MIHMKTFEAARSPSVPGQRRMRPRDPSRRVTQASRHGPSASLGHRACMRDNKRHVVEATCLVEGKVAQVCSETAPKEQARAARRRDAARRRPWCPKGGACGGTVLVPRASQRVSSSVGACPARREVAILGRALKPSRRAPARALVVVERSVGGGQGGVGAGGRQVPRRGVGRRQRSFASSGATRGTAAVLASNLYPCDIL
jgi:hypothetical protein